MPPPPRDPSVAKKNTLCILHGEFSGKYAVIYLFFDGDDGDWQDVSNRYLYLEFR